jgi:hypothetical protein
MRGNLSLEMKLKLGLITKEDYDKEIALASDSKPEKLSVATAPVDIVVQKEEAPMLLDDSQADSLCDTIIDCGYNFRFCADVVDEVEKYTGFNFGYSRSSKFFIKLKDKNIRIAHDENENDRPQEVVNALANISSPSFRAEGGPKILLKYAYKLGILNGNDLHHLANNDSNKIRVIDNSNELPKSSAHQAAFNIDSMRAYDIAKNIGILCKAIKTHINQTQKERIIDADAQIISADRLNQFYNEMNGIFSNSVEMNLIKQAAETLKENLSGKENITDENVSSAVESIQKNNSNKERLLSKESLTNMLKKSLRAFPPLRLQFEGIGKETNPIEIIDNLTSFTHPTLNPFFMKVQQYYLATVKANQALEIYSTITSFAEEKKNELKKALENQMKAEKAAEISQSKLDANRAKAKSKSAGISMFDQLKARGGESSVLGEKQRIIVSSDQIAAISLNKKFTESMANISKAKNITEEILNSHHHELKQHLEELERTCLACKAAAIKGDKKQINTLQELMSGTSESILNMIPILSQDTTLAVEGRNERLIKQGEIFNKLILSKKPDINNIMEKGLNDVWKESLHINEREKIMLNSKEAVKSISSLQELLSAVTPEVLDFLAGKKQAKFSTTASSKDEVKSEINSELQGKMNEVDEARETLEGLMRLANINFDLEKREYTVGNKQKNSADRKSVAAFDEMGASAKESLEEKSIYSQTRRSKFAAPGSKVTTDSKNDDLLAAESKDSFVNSRFGGSKKTTDLKDVHIDDIKFELADEKGSDRFTSMVKSSSYQSSINDSKSQNLSHVELTRKKKRSSKIQLFV